MSEVAKPLREKNNHRDTCSQGQWPLLRALVTQVPKKWLRSLSLCLVRACPHTEPRTLHRTGALRKVTLARAPCSTPEVRAQPQPRALRELRVQTKWVDTVQLLYSCQPLKQGACVTCILLPITGLGNTSLTCSEKTLRGRQVTPLREQTLGQGLGQCAPRRLAGICDSQVVLCWGEILSLASYHTRDMETDPDCHLGIITFPDWTLFHGSSSPAAHPEVPGKGDGRKWEK